MSLPLCLSVLVSIIDDVKDLLFHHLLLIARHYTYTCRLGNKLPKLQVYMLWFNFIFGLNFTFLCFRLIIIHYYTPKQREIKFEPRIKLNHNIYTGTYELDRN